MRINSIYVKAVLVTFFFAIVACNMKRVNSADSGVVEDNDTNANDNLNANVNLNVNQTSYDNDNVNVNWLRV